MSTWNGWPVAEMPLASLTPLVGVVDKRPIFQRKLRDSIKAHGLQNPLLAAWVTPAAWQSRWGRSGRYMTEAPTEPTLMVLVGCQRYHVLTELGATTAPVCIMPSIDAARAMVGESHKGWRHLYGERDDESTEECSVDRCGHLWRGMPIVRLKLSEMVPAWGRVGQAFTDKLRESIDKHGMANPLLIAEVSHESWEEDRKEAWTLRRPDRPVLAVIVGNQRYHILEERGEPCAPVVIMPSVEDARKNAAAMRAGWPDDRPPKGERAKGRG